MELKEIAAVSGKPGLFKIVKPTRTGLILESMDGHNTKIVTGPSNRVSLLHEISIYTEDYEKTIPLAEIFVKIKKEFGDDPGVDGKSDPDELKAFMEHVVPDYDRDKVYVSDMKKLVIWYGILAKNAPELLVEPEEVTKEKESEPLEKPAEDTAVPETKNQLKPPSGKAKSSDTVPVGKKKKS
jgi:hypothetical protein